MKPLKPLAYTRAQYLLDAANKPFMVRVQTHTVSRWATRAEARAEVDRLKAEGYAAELAWY